MRVFALDFKKQKVGANLFALHLQKIGMNLRLPFFVFLIFLGFTNRIFAADNVLDVSQLNQNSVSLTEYFAVFDDSTAKLTLIDVQTPDIASRFKVDQKPAEALNFGYSSTAHWLRLVLRNTSNQAVERMLEISDARLSNVQFYQPIENNLYSVVTTGMMFPFSTRPYKNRYFVFPITVPANSEQTYYLRITSKMVALVPANLWSPQAFQAHERRDYVAQAWYFGMVSAMVLFNLLLFVLLRDIIYLLYVNSSLGIALSIAGINGLFKEFLFPDSTFWVDKTVPYLTALSTLVFLVFVRYMLKTKEIVPKFDQLIKLLIGIFFVVLVALTIVPLHVPVKPLVVIYLLTPFLILTVCVLCVFKRQRSAYIFSMAFFIFLIGAVLTQMRNIGVLPTNIFTINALQIGSALEMVLMAIALADRFHLIRKEKEKTQAQLLQAQQLLVANLQSSEQMLETRVAERTTALEMANLQLKALSTTDGLTGIANRRRFDEVLASEWNRAARQNHSLALALLDVDWFKKYNDHYGHQMGDECLKNVAKILAQNICRTGDLVARYGGEEFVFIAPVTDEITALNMAKKVCHTLESLGLPHAMSDFGCVTVSIGVVAIIPKEGVAPEILIKAADEALYHAKEHGRNQAILTMIRL